jgi:hypothetical protein
VTARDPLFVSGAVTSATEARLGLAGLLAAGSTAGAARPGIMYGPGNPFAVSGTSTMAYSVAAGQGVVVRSASGGAYIGGNDGTVTVTTTASPPSGSRYDVIYLQFVDTELDGSTSAGVLGVIQGTSSGSPTAPAVPTGAIAIAQALVPSSASRTDTGVTITQVAPFTAARGGVVPFRSATEQSAATAYESFLGYRLDTNLLEYHNGSEWALLPAGPAMPASTADTGGISSITALTWGTPGLSATAAITNPSAARSLLCDVKYTAWLSASGAAVRAAPSISGAVTAVPSGTALPPACAGWGEVLYQGAPASGTSYSQMGASVPLSVPAGGTVTVTMKALRDSATGTQSLNYPTIRIIPVRYQ